MPVVSFVTCFGTAFPEVRHNEACTGSANLGVSALAALSLQRSTRSAVQGQNLSSYVYLNHVVFAAAILGLSIVLVIAVLLTIFFRHLRTRDTDDAPDPLRPYIRTGGLAIVVAFLAGILLVHLFGVFTPIAAQYFWGFLTSIFLIAAVGLYGTFRYIGPATRVAAQVFAVAIVMWAGIVIDEIRLPWIGWVVGGWWTYPMTLLWILGLTNIYTTFDGVDGLSASGAVIASAFFGFIALHHGSAFTYLCSVAMFAASVGFLIFNWPPAKISMGEIGGAFLGFSFAVMAIIAGLYDHSHTSLFVIPLLLFHFIFDAVFTFCARVFRSGSQPHGESMHLYRLLARAGHSHRGIIAIYSCMGIAQGFGAILMVNLGNSRMWVFLPFLLFQAGYAYWLIGSSRTREASAI
jgi:UDP-N-acetylmuramyl pentapeptide phosphotransferase/UDP-N-acetylglucosamine-1-phosphate transferase